MSSIGKTFMAPGPARTRPAGVSRSALRDARVQVLRDAAMEACLLISEDEPMEEAMERCTSLSYELATAEQMLRMHKEDEARYEAMDTDSW